MADTHISCLILLFCRLLFAATNWPKILLMATATQSSSTVNGTTDANNVFLSATVVAGLKNLGTTLTVAISKTLIANSLKLTLHPDASMKPPCVPKLKTTFENNYVCVSIYSINFISYCTSARNICNERCQRETERIRRSHPLCRSDQTRMGQ